MRVLKVIAEGITTSFRYPHFIQQVHPSFPMPPPTTIYGHIASALGEWFDPTGVQFAYHFTYAGKINREIEHTILLSSTTGYLKDSKIPKVLEGNVNPFYREIFFYPRLVLYINQPEWEEAFRYPRYAVILGRSQDLFTYTSVQTIELTQAPSAYFEHTLLSYTGTRYTDRGYMVLMPRYLDNERDRYPSFERYLAIHERVSSTQFLWFGVEASKFYWIDPTSSELHGEYLGLDFLSFVGSD